MANAYHYARHSRKWRTRKKHLRRLGLAKGEQEAQRSVDSIREAFGSAWTGQALVRRKLRERVMELRRLPWKSLREVTLTMIP